MVQNHYWNDLYWHTHKYGYWNGQKGYWRIKNGKASLRRCAILIVPASHPKQFCDCLSPCFLIRRSKPSAKGRRLQAVAPAGIASKQQNFSRIIKVLTLFEKIGREFQLEVLSEIGEGTTVTMRIPLRKQFGVGLEAKRAISSEVSELAPS